MLTPKNLHRPSNKSLLIVALAAGSLAFLFFGKGSLADVYYFLAGTVGMVAFFRLKKLKEEIDETKKRISERVEEVEFRIDKLEEKTVKM